MSDRFSATARARSFGFAMRGLATLVRDEPNARIHLAIGLAVIGLALMLDVSAAGFCWLVLAMALVLCAEAANTAIERLADAAVPEENLLIGQAKDVAAGGVLMAALAAALVGLLVLGPPLLDALGSNEIAASDLSAPR